MFPDEVAIKKFRKWSKIKIIQLGMYEFFC